MSEYLEKDVFEMNDLEFADWIERSFLDGWNNVQICSFFKNINDQVVQINKQLRENSIAAQTGEISRNSQLHGFLFEKLHAYTFNAKAALAHKNFRAYVLPIDGGYGKNSVDISIRELGSKKVLRNYQAKCCVNAEAAIKAFEHGDYRNQRYLVCKGQDERVKNFCSSCKSVNDHIEYDGISSTPQKYSQVKALQNAMQSGDFNNINCLDVFTNKELILNGIEWVGKTVASDALLKSAAITVNHAILHSEKSFKEEVIANAKDLGWDAVKSAVSESLVLAIKNKEHDIPELLKEIPEEQIVSASYAISGLLVDVIHIGYGYSTGEYSEVEAYKLVIRSVIKTACRITGGAIAGHFTGGIGKLAGVMAGDWAGEKLVNLIGEENLEKAAQGCIDLKNKANEILEYGTEKIEMLMQLSENYVLEAN